MTEATIPHPEIVSQTEWQAAHDKLLAKEKAATRARDALAAERRRLPRLRIEKHYVFEGPQGTASLRDLFEGRRQLILYSFMFAPGVNGWPTAGCPAARSSSITLEIPTTCTLAMCPSCWCREHRSRISSDTGSAWVGPCRGTPRPRTTSTSTSVSRKTTRNYTGSTYFYATVTAFSTRTTPVRVAPKRSGATWGLLDMTPFGRQENWEDSPAGTPQTPPYEWWRRHDEYGKQPRHET